MTIVPHDNFLRVEVVVVVCGGRRSFDGVDVDNDDDDVVVMVFPLCVWVFLLCANNLHS